MKLKSHKQKYQYLTTSLALGIVSFGVLIAKSAEAVSLLWTLDSNTSTEIVFSALIPNAIADWDTFNQNQDYIIDNIPAPNTVDVDGFTAIIPTTPLTSASLGIKGDFIFNGQVTVPIDGTGRGWEVNGTASADNWTIAPGGVDLDGAIPIGVAGGPGTTDILFQDVRREYDFKRTINSPTTPVGISSVTLRYSFTPNLTGFTSPTGPIVGTQVNGNITNWVGFQPGNIATVTYNYAPQNNQNNPNVVPFDFSSTPGLLGIAGIFGLKYFMGKVKKKPKN